MYNDFFGFRERPFSVTPDPRVFYATPSYQRIYNNLVYNIIEGKSLAVLTGEVGTGKTTVLRRIMREFERSIRFAYFTYTTLPFEDLLDFVCEDLEIPCQPSGQLQKLKALQECLAARQKTGQSAVLLIDEAQNLQETVLEEIRHLLNLTTESKTLLPIILVGQPELEKKLASPTLHQLKQRVTVHCQLDRLKDREIAPFIAHRLQAVGYTREDLFTAEAIERLTVYSQGVPRLINILCDNVLLLGYSISQQTISAEMIEEVAQDLGLHAGPPPSGETAVTPPQNIEAPRDALLFSVPQGETNPAPEEVLPAVQPQPPVQLTVNIDPSTTEQKPEYPVRLSPSRRLAWAGTGLAFALWSVTFFPYSDGEESTVTPPTSSVQSPGNPSTLVDRVNAFFGRTGTPAERLQQETASSSGTAKESQTNNTARDATSVQTTADLTPPAPREPIRVSPQTHSANANAQQPVSTQEESAPLRGHDPELIDVASQGNPQEAQRLLDAGVHPNVTDEKGWSPLMMATLHGHTVIVQLLLKHGADVNVANSTGGTALMMAALQGQDTILQVLLDNGARVDTQDTKGWTALMYAARNGYASTVEILLSSGAEVNLKNDEGRTALMYATAKGHREAINALQNGRAVSSAMN